jgi:hypothetical protein
MIRSEGPAFVLMIIIRQKFASARFGFYVRNYLLCPNGVDFSYHPDAWERRPVKMQYS